MALALSLSAVLVSAEAVAQVGPPGPDVHTALAAPGAREAIARVAYAEAANQGDSGRLAVVYTILNRVADQRWGASVDQVLNARSQFEPVMRAGGDWRALPAATPVQRARIDTLINLVLEGRAPDLTGGALYFQNPRIVAARAAAGQVAPGLVHFGGAAPSAVIGDHAFYLATGRARRAKVAAAAPEAIFVPKRAPPGAAVSPVASAPAAPGRGIFVLSDGQAVESRR
ncbi:cell wall hydrolase [Caulobacter sp.]|uniref:cell wall hydrolase n=1 Tax=Caulobacter sp. TaxID=78 RepID=UPI0025B8581D|nr:cell wall hydrolase [Caulobacter sp.]